MKGDPATIARFCSPDSLPKNYMKEIRDYQAKGYRVLCYCTKALSIAMASNLKEALNLSRVQVEEEGSFTFIGIVVMDNQLKWSTN